MLPEACINTKLLELFLQVSHRICSGYRIAITPAGNIEAACMNSQVRKASTGVCLTLLIQKKYQDPWGHMRVCWQQQACLVCWVPSPSCTNSSQAMRSVCWGKPSKERKAQMSSEMKEAWIEDVGFSRCTCTVYSTSVALQFTWKW